MAHVLCFVEFGDILQAITDDPSLDTERSVARCRIELANYFAAALLVPYERFLELARRRNTTSTGWHPPFPCRSSRHASA